MKKQKFGILLLEILGFLLFLLFLSPIVLLVINSAKRSACTSCKFRTTLDKHCYYLEKPIY